MHGQAAIVAEELRVLQDQSSRLARHLCLLMRVREGDQVRVEWTFGGQVTVQVGVVRVMSDFTFFLELSSGALLLVEDVQHLEILRSGAVNDDSD